MCTHMNCQKCGTALKVTKSTLNFGAVEPCKGCSKKEDPTHLEILQEAFERVGVGTAVEESLTAIYLYPDIHKMPRITFNKSGSWRTEP